MSTNKFYFIWNRGSITYLLNFQTQCQIRVTWMYLWTDASVSNMEKQIMWEKYWTLVTVLMSLSVFSARMKIGHGVVVEEICFQTIWDFKENRDLAFEIWPRDFNFLLKRFKIWVCALICHLPVTEVGLYCCALPYRNALNVRVLPVSGIYDVPGDCVISIYWIVWTSNGL